jgi:protein-S-isoprenylcysteine O-methyltransferase Ste14
MPLGHRLTLILLATAVYLSLAVLGWGGIEAFFSRPARVSLVIVTFALAGASVFAGGSLSRGEREDRGNRWVIAALGLTGVLIGYLPAYTDRHELWTIDSDSIRWLGVALYAIGGTLRIWPVFILGNRFSGLVAIQPGHELVTTGIYGVIRHPSYLGLMVNALGWALTFRSGVGVLLTALTLGPIISRIHSEEALLRSQFGNDYEAYRARTWRLIPGLY